MLPLRQQLLALLSIIGNNDREEVCTHTEAEMRISFPLANTSYLQNKTLLREHLPK